MTTEYYNYINTTVYKGDTEVAPGDGVIVSKAENKVYAATTCIRTQLNQVDNLGVWELSLQLEEGNKLTLKNPWASADRLLTQLEQYKDNYLEFPRSYISMARIRPYGVGIHTGDVIKSALRVEDIAHDLVSQIDLFFSAPKLRRGDEFLVFKTKKYLKRVFNKTIEIPIFVDQSLECHAKKKPDLFPSIGDWVQNHNKQSKIKVINNGTCLSQSGDMYRKYRCQKASMDIDRYAYLDVKKALVA